MRLYKGTHEYYCGVDLHGKSMYVCVMDREGGVHLHRKLRNDVGYFLGLMAPYRASLCVAAESTFNWYWLADALSETEIEFVLGHAQYMKAIHGGKAKNDRIDSQKIAELVRSGMLPIGYVYPRKMRRVRDLLRRRTKFARQRAELLTHIENTNSQYLLGLLPADPKQVKNRDLVVEHFEDELVRATIEADLALIERYESVIRDLERRILRETRREHRGELKVLVSAPGIGKIVALTILYEVHQISRFKSEGDFSSYSRLVKCSASSNGKLYGFHGNKIGNPYLKWAFSEAAVYAVRRYPLIRRHRERLMSKYGKGKSLTVLAHALGIAVYHMLKKNECFSMEKFLK